jgi:hypothetical protein
MEEILEVQAVCRAVEVEKHLEGKREEARAKSQLVEKLSAMKLAKSSLRSHLREVNESCIQDGVFYDPVRHEIHISLIPTLCNEAAAMCHQKSQVDGIMQSIPLDHFFYFANRVDRYPERHARSAMQQQHPPVWVI